MKNIVLLISLCLTSFIGISQTRVNCSLLEDNFEKYEGKMITGKFYYYYDDNPKGYGIRYSPGEWLSIREENENTYSRVCTCENDRVYFHLEIPRDIAVPNLTSGFIVVTGTFRVERGGGSTMPFIKVKSIRRLQQ